MENISKESCLKIIEFHKLCNKLKTTLRQGWVNWAVEIERVESIAEHIFGTGMLAVSILASINHSLDINKILSMLMIHETEELIIGDITPIEIDKVKSKKEMGRKAVLEIFKDFPFKSHFLSLIEEFEERKTPEAKFAYQCDKLEADLQALIYEKDVNYNKIDKSLKTDERILGWKNEGYSKMSEFFLQSDKAKYEGVFFELSNLLEEMQKKI